MLSLGGCFVFGALVKFTKRPLTFEEQRKRVRGRGLQGDDEHIERTLRQTNYYRLSAYWHTFRRIDPATKQRGEDLADGCTLDLVLERYAFDRKLRLLVFDAVERVEIYFRTLLAYHHSHEHGPFAYVEDEDALPKLKGPEKAQRRGELLDRIAEEARRSDDNFVRHFQKKYGDHHSSLPLWMATEIMTFRTLLTIFENCSKKVKNAVSTGFGVPDTVLNSWLLTLNTVRNVCAHHGRLWNRQIGNTPIIPTGTEHRSWNTPVRITQDRMFAVLTMLNFCVERAAPDDHWAGRFRALLDRHPVVPVRYMGFPNNWTESPLWRGAVLEIDKRPEPVLPDEHPFPER